MASAVAFVVKVTFLVFAVASLTAEARVHLVGGKAGAWKVPSSHADSLNKWAQNSRFQVGDTLLWKYDSKKDSVLQVTRDAYLHCNTTNPIAAYIGEQANKTLNHPGPFYFISGASNNCEKGEKLIVVVMSPRDKMLAPAPSPSQITETPALAPTSGVGCLKVVAGTTTLVAIVLGVFALLI